MPAHKQTEAQPTGDGQSVTLYYREGSSDKIYRAAIEPKDDGFVVNFAFGRRGMTLQGGTKTAKPLDFAAAKKIYDKIVREKTAKGYTPGADGVRYQQTDKADRATGIVPQLLNAIAEEEAEKLIADANWWAQEKFDGRRVMVRKTGGEVTGLNRQGLLIALPDPIVQFAAGLAGDQWLIDGEAVGDVLYAFDLLEHAGTDFRGKPYSARLSALGQATGSSAATPIRVVETATTAVAKRSLLKKLTQEKREGIVFKRHDAKFAPGRPAGGGSQVKFKFTATASCIVAGVNGSKRSVSLELLDGARQVNVGNVTIPAGKTIPQAGDLVEVRYLYAYAGGSLFQPVFLGVRDDIAREACAVGQLKLKAADEDRDIES